MGDLDGKTIILTGFTAGIGKATAMELARRGANLGLVGRSPDKCAAVLEELRAATGNTQLRVFLCDLSLMKEVKRLAGELLEAYPRIDVLLNNAGLFSAKRTLTAEDLELTFAANHMGYYILTRMLEERLKASAPARVVNVASAAHKNAELDFDDLQSAKNYGAFAVYCKSKLANIYFTRVMAERLQGSGVTVNCLHPGVIASDLIRPWGMLVAFVWKLFTASTENGARTSLFLATDPSVADTTGQYFDESKVARISAAARDDEAARRLWEESARIAGMEA